ncbi:MAG: glycosyltransferase [Bacteroidota bacterium]|nr:glycosyltransferase [Flavisolibacter sp.]MDQ3551533.1 glycosyltransferase [Bacteroidota bacterium]
MKIKLFYHSLLSDWNHGNAHFLRGVATELIRRGNIVEVYESENSWSLTNLIADGGKTALEDFHNYYPDLKTNFYNPKNINLDNLLFDADLVMVHEWNDHELVKKIGDKRKKYPFKLLFHDTHHRAVTDKENMKSYDLSNYDGVLVFGELIKEIYLKEEWTTKAWTWHEAADINIFQPLPTTDYEGDLVWIGNWGDDERTKELHQFLIEPVRELNLKAKVYGVRYPAHAKKSLKEAGIEYGGWLPNFKAPEVFAKYKFTVHVPRRPYVESLPGIPTIRPFEAMACAIPLISSTWNDSEHLFEAGKDYLQVKNKNEMMENMKRILQDEAFATQISEHGLKTIHAKHTCAHRVNELYEICEEIGVKNSLKKDIV